MTFIRPLLAAPIHEFDGDIAIQWEKGKPAHRVPLRFPLIVSPKIDGIRALCHSRRVQTRKGLLLPNNHVRGLLSDLPFHDGELVIAGTAMSPNCFSLAQSAFMSEHTKPQFEYHVFDVLGFDQEPFTARLERLQRWCSVREFEFPWVRFVPQHLVEDMAGLLAWESHYLELGFEGLMLRKPDGGYKHNRSTLREQILIKVKRFADDEAEIVGFEELQRNFNAAETDNLGYTKRSHSQAGKFGDGTLGKFLCRSPKWQYVFSVGSGQGMTAEFRDYVWAHRDEFRGKFINYRYQAVGSIDRPRIPLFHGIRKD